MFFWGLYCVIHVMFNVLGSLKLSPTIDLWEVDLVSKEKWVRHFFLYWNSFGVHLVVQGRTWWKALGTWYVWLACSNINTPLHVRTLKSQSSQSKKSKLHHSTDLHGHISVPGDCHNMRGKWSHVCSAQFIVYRCFSTSITDGQRKERRPST